MKSRQARDTCDVALRRRGGVVCSVHGLAGAQQRLGRDARPVGALAADELALDEGDPKAALGKCARGVLARRAAAEDDHVVVAHSGELRACLLRDHVCGGVPVGPVRIRLAGALLVLAVRGCRADERVHQIVQGAVRRRRRIDTARQPAGDLLQEPAVPSGSLNDAKERYVPSGDGPASRSASWKRPARSPLVEDLAHVDAVGGSSLRAASMSETTRYRP